MYGKVTSAWELKDGRFELAVEIPANTRATVRLPNADATNVTESGKPLAEGNGIVKVRQDSKGAVVEIGSGQYRFAYAYPTNK
jgi:alpha-L-rhamnosidase